MLSDVTYDCPTCDFTSGSKGGVAIHHSHAHGESIAKSDYECDVCGTVEERYDCNVTGEVVWCSDACEREYKQNLAPEDHPRWKGGKVTVGCYTCGDTKQVKRYRLNGSERFFCSKNCYGEWVSEQRGGVDDPQFDSVRVECDWCGGGTYKLEHRIERSEQDFCSLECHGKWMSKYQHGPNHHQWTGGRRDYGPGWNERKRESVRERDGRECFDCGIVESESIAEYGRKLDVHHLVPPTSDTNPAVHNGKRNLVTLCVRCHHEWESNSHPVTPSAVSTEVCES